MLLENHDVETIAVQLIDVNGTEMTAKTENNDLIKIETQDQVKKDRSFLQVMKDIAKAKIWLPVTKGTHQLLQYDWLSQNDAEFA